MQVRYDEGVAIHIGPEPCGDIREDGGEASAGECTGQPLSRENGLSRMPTRLDNAEGNTLGRVIASASSGPAWSKTLACAEAPCAGTGRSRFRPAGGHRRSASGRRGAVADDARSPRSLTPP